MISASKLRQLIATGRAVLRQHYHGGEETRRARLESWFDDLERTMREHEGQPPEPTTKLEALEQAARWGTTLSYWNTYCGSLDDRPAELALCARADLAEKERLIQLSKCLP